MDPLSMGLIFLAMIALIYFVTVRPANKRAKEQQETVNAIQPGSRVVLASGQFGTVRHVGDKQMAVELAPGCVVTVLKAAVARPAEPDEEEFEYEDATDELQPATTAAAVSGGATVAVPPEPVVAQDPFYAGTEPRGASDPLLEEPSYGARTDSELAAQGEQHLNEER